MAVKGSAKGSANQGISGDFRGRMRGLAISLFPGGFFEATNLRSQFFDPFDCIRCADQTTSRLERIHLSPRILEGFVIDHRITVIHGGTLVPHDVPPGLAVNAGFPHLVLCRSAEIMKVKVDGFEAVLLHAIS